MSGKSKKIIQNTLAVCFWLVLWQAASVSIGSSILLVSPTAVVQTLCHLVFTSAFWATLYASSMRILTGFLCAVCVGTVLAVVSKCVSFVKILLLPAMATVKSVPVASFIILALMWLKNASNLAVFISFLMALPIIYTNTLAGIQSVDVQLLEMAQVFRVPFWRVVRYIYVPAVWRYFRSACAVGIGLCWKSGVAAEVIGITTGSIGAELYNAKILFSTAELFAWTATLVMLSACAEKLFLALLSVLYRMIAQGDGL